MLANTEDDDGLNDMPLSTAIPLLRVQSWDSTRDTSKETKEVTCPVSVKNGKERTLKERPGHRVEWLKRGLGSAMPPSESCFVPGTPIPILITKLKQAEYSGGKKTLTEAQILLLLLAICQYENVPNICEHQFSQSYSRIKWDTMHK